MTKASILVVDDSLIIRKMLGRMLKQDGYGLFEADSGEAALRMLEAHAVDGIILDLHMGDMTGFHFLERLRDAGRHIPVIVLSADQQQSSREMVLDLGGKYFLNKPPQESILREALHDVLSP